MPAPNLPNIHLRGNPQIYDCESDWNWHPAPLRDFDLWWILGGQGRLDRNGQKQSLSLGDCLLFRPGEKLEAGHDPAHPLRVFALHFEARGKWHEFFQTLPPRKKIPRIEDLEQLARQTSLPSSRAGRFAAERARLGALQCLLFYADAEPAQSDTAETALDEAVRAMRQSPGKIVSIEALSRQAGMSFAHFSRAFKKRHGEPPKQFLTRVKMERAAALLRESTMTLDAIADALGYGDGLQFSKQFSRWHGTPPGLFRRQGRAGT